MTGRDDPGRRTVVVGVGNEFRRDDGAEPEVIARLRALQPGDAGLARVLGRLPARLTVLAVVGRDFGFGTEMTAEVAAAIAELVEQVREIVRLPDRGRNSGQASRHRPFGERILDLFRTDGGFTIPRRSRRHHGAPLAPRSART